MILREDLLAKVSYPGRLTRRDIIPQGDRLARISNHEKIDRPGYHTPGRLKNLNNSANSELKSKIFYPIGQWPRYVRIMKKKLRGRKSC